MTPFQKRLTIWYYKIVVYEKSVMTAAFMLIMLFFVAPITWTTVHIIDKNKAGETKTSYVAAPILSSDTLSSGNRTKVRVTVRLANGEELSIRTTNPKIYATLFDQACVSITKELTAERRWVSLAPSNNCS